MKKDDNKYQSPIAQIIESAGNFVNNVKERWFVIVILLILTFSFLAYKYLDIATKNLEANLLIKKALYEQNDLVAKQNYLLDGIPKKDSHKDDIENP